MNLATLAYIPGSHFGHPEVFLENLYRYRTTYPLITFSHFNDKADVHIGNPEIVSGARNADGTTKSYAISNLIFLTSLRIALSKGLTHMIYIEPDSRVGEKGWDERMFDSFFHSGKPTVLGGSICVYGPCASGWDATVRWMRFMQEENALPLPGTYAQWGVHFRTPVNCYGKDDEILNRKTCVFSMGSLSVLDVKYISSLFPLENTGGLASTSGPWDLEIGFRMWDQVQENAYDLVHHIPCVLSTYGEGMTTEAQRLDLLKMHKVVAIHQVKSEATI